MLYFGFITAKMVLETHRCIPAGVITSKACLAALPELNRVQGTGRGWAISARKRRTTIGKGEAGKESLEETQALMLLLKPALGEEQGSHQHQCWWTQPVLSSGGKRLVWAARPKLFCCLLGTLLGDFSSLIPRSAWWECGCSQLAF